MWRILIAAVALVGGLNTVRANTLDYPFILFVEYANPNAPQPCFSSPGCTDIYLAPIGTVEITTDANNALIGSAIFWVGQEVSQFTLAGLPDNFWIIFGGNGGGLLTYSSNSPTSAVISLSPALDPVPLPATALLFLTGLCFLILIAARPRTRIATDVVVDRSLKPILLRIGTIIKTPIRQPRRASDYLLA